MININLSVDGVGESMDKKKGKKYNYPSLYDVFELGDRVKRTYKDKASKYEYRGIVLAIEDKSIEIYWDTKNDRYRPGDMNIAFTNCPINEIFKGSDHYTPIRKDEH